MSFTTAASPAAPATGGGFSFGGGATTSSATPAAAGGGFSFGSGAAAAGAPAAPTAFSFGSTNAPSTTTPATPATPGATTTTTAATTGFSFGGAAAGTPAGVATTAAATTTTPAASSSGVFSFGNANTAVTTSTATTTTAAPAAPFSFGSSTTIAKSPVAPTPSTAVAPFGGIGAASPGSSTTPGVVAPMHISGSTPYASLPPEIQKAFDTIHEAMMKHKRTVANLQTMAPQLLLNPDLAAGTAHATHAADKAAGAPGGTTALAAVSEQQHGSVSANASALSTTITKVKQDITALQQEISRCVQPANRVKENYETLLTQSVAYGKWPVEAIAVRRGLQLRTLPKQQQHPVVDPSNPAAALHQHPNVQNTSSTATSTSTTQDPAKKELEAMLDRQLAYVDRVERMPSPYLWQILQDMEKRASILAHQVQKLQQQVLGSQTMSPEEPVNITSVVQSQQQALVQCATRITFLQDKVEQVRQQYRVWEDKQHGHGQRGQESRNVLDQADRQEYQHQQRIEDQIRMQYVQVAVSATQQQPQPPQQQQQPGGGGLFGTPTTAPGGSLFGQPAPAPATTGSLFGQPAPAPATTGSLFGQPAQTPAPGGSLFGQPAPAPGGSLFGQPAPAPAAAGGSLFGSTPTSTTPGAPAPGGSLFSFGGAAATTPTTPSTFGTPGATAPAPAFNFTSSTSSSTTPKSKSKSRAGRLRR